MRRFLCGTLCVLTGFASVSSAVTGAVAETVHFSVGEVPQGWTVENGEYRSPEYSNAVDRIELRYSGAGASASATVSAFSKQGGETTVATFTAVSSAASFDFPDTTDFRSFRITPINGLTLSSFAAYVSAEALDAPSGVTISNNITGTSFDASWSAVDGATGYKVYVWTNAVVGASAGTAVWQETMPGATNDANNTVLNDNKFAACFANPGWTRLGKAGYPTGENGTIRIGTASETGWIQTPQINYAADGMALRFFAKANATNTKSMDIAIERVSGGVATLAGTATLTTEMQDFTIVLPDWGSGDCIRFNSITNGDKRTIIGSVAVVSGYSDGSVTPLYIVDGLDVGSATSHSFTGFPSVPVQFGVEAYGRHGISSATSETIEVDLANPDKVAILNACPLSSLAGTANTYSQSFDSLSAITATTGNKDLLNGTTILYWQFYKGSDAANSIKHNSGTGNTGGLYALAANLDLPERALGAYSTRNDEFSFGIAFTNDTDRTIVLSSIAYSAQQWGFNNTTNQTLSVSVKVVDGLDWISAYGDGWMELNSTKSAVYGSGDTHDTPVSTPVMVDPQEEIAIASGQVLMLKWTVHSLKSGTAGMMGIDDVSMTFAVQRSKNALVIRLAGNTEK